MTAVNWGFSGRSEVKRGEPGEGDYPQGGRGNDQWLAAPLNTHTHTPEMTDSPTYSLNFLHPYPLHTLLPTLHLPRLTPNPHNISLVINEWMS